MSAADLTVSTALAAVLRAASLDEAQAAARAGLDRIAADTPCDVMEVVEAAQLVGRTTSTVRRWCAERHIGRRLGGRWIVSRRRIVAMVEGGR